MLLKVIEDLTDRVRADIKTIDNKTYLDAHLIDEFFRLVTDNWQVLKTPEIAPTYLKLQNLVVGVLLGIIVNRESGNIYNSMMTYNAGCTEETLHYFFNIPFGGDGELEHLHIHTGWGNGTSDFDAGRPVYIRIKGANSEKYVVIGPKIEVKDYRDLTSAEKYFEQDAETSVYHDSNHVFLHIMDTDTYYVAENRKTSNWLLLADSGKIKLVRRQVKLWIDDDGFLGVRFR